MTRARLKHEIHTASKSQSSGRVSPGRAELGQPGRAPLFTSNVSVPNFISRKLGLRHAISTKALNAANGQSQKSGRIAPSRHASRSCTAVSVNSPPRLPHQARIGRTQSAMPPKAHVIPAMKIPT